MVSSQLGNAELGNFELGALPSGGGSNIDLFPGPGSITITGGTPTVSFSGGGLITLSPGTGSITLTGGTPTVDFTGTLTLSPGAGTITLTGGLPEVFLDTGIPAHPLPYSLTITGGTPTVTVSLNPGPGQIQLTGYQLGVTLVRTTGTGNQLYIGDNLYTTWKDSTFRISKTLSGEWSASFDLDYYGGNRPVVGDEVAMFWDSVKRFGGRVQKVREVGVPGLSTFKSIIRITCGGFTNEVDRVVYAKLVTLALGGVTGINVYNFWYEKLRELGLEKIGDTPSTFMPEVLFLYLKGSEVLNKIREQDPGYDWWVDDNKLLHYELTDPAQGANAPFAISGSLGDKGNCDRLEVEVSNTRFRNRQFVMPTADLIALRDDVRVGDGSSTSFSTDYPLNSKPIVRVDGVDQLVTEGGDWITGWQFYYIPGSVGVFAATAPAVALVVDIIYPSPFPVAEMAEDAASIAAVGPYEEIYFARSIYTRPEAQAMAQGFIDLFATGGYPTEVELEYNSIDQPDWLEPGMRISLNTTYPTASGVFTVEQVDSQEQDLTLWRHTVTLRSGLGEVTDSQAIAQGRTNSRVPIDSPPYRLNWALFMDVAGLTNPGAALGAVKATQSAQCAGVISGWTILFADDPPTGADFEMDVLQNGVSIFLPGAGNQVLAEDGVTTLQRGIRFLTDNVTVRQGDKFTLNVTAIGSSNKGANATFTLEIKVPANPAQVN